MARPVGPVVAVAAVALDFTPDLAARPTAQPGNLARTTPLTAQLSDHLSFFPGELSVLHGITLAGVNPSVGQLTLLFKPGVALGLSIPEDCIECASHGYHCSLFQLPSITHCPWHGHDLHTQCRQRGSTCWATFNSDLRLGRCHFTFDAFDATKVSVEMGKFPFGNADGWISEFLERSSATRRCVSMVLPPFHMNWAAGYAARASCHSDNSALVPDYGPHEVQEFLGDGREPQEGEFWGWRRLDKISGRRHLLAALVAILARATLRD